MEASAGLDNTASISGEDPIVQYVVLRRDLWQDRGWPLGSVAAQACHAATAVMWMYKDDDTVREYCGDLDHMRKVVLEVKGETQLLNLSKKLDENGILHKVGDLIKTSCLTRLFLARYLRPS